MNKSSFSNLSFFFLFFILPFIYKKEKGGGEGVKKKWIKFIIVGVEQNWNFNLVIDSKIFVWFFFNLLFYELKFISSFSKSFPTIINTNSITWLTTICWTSLENYYDSFHLNQFVSMIFNKSSFNELIEFRALFMVNATQRTRKVA